MVTVRGLKIGALALVVTSFLATSCGARDGGADAVVQSTASVDDRTTAPTPISTPFIRCDGLRGVDDALALIEAGKATALVEAGIGDTLGKTDYDRTVGVESYEVLAGDLAQGGLKQLQLEPVIDNFDPFPRGSYVLLVGPTGDGDGAYFVSDGLRGSFIADGGSVFERCPNYEDPLSPLIIRDGVTDRDAVIDLFNQAFAQVGSEGSPTPQ